jgi:hypothetical protein
MQAFNIKLGRKIIDRVFYNEGFTVEDVKQALVSHDGYDANIVVTKVRRVLKDEFEIQGNYGHGWDVECTEETRKEANQRLKEYRENAGTIGSHRIVHKRVPV